MTKDSVTTNPAATLCAKYIVRKYIELGVKFVVKKNVYAEQMRHEIEQAINDAYEQGVKDGAKR